MPLKIYLKVPFRRCAPYQNLPKRALLKNVQEDVREVSFKFNELATDFEGS